MLVLYKNIKARRLELGLTQTDLAHKMGYADKSMIAKIEKGSIDLPQSKIIDVAEALQTTPSYLMGWEDHTNGSQSEIDIKNIEDILQIETKQIPLLGTIACGVPNLAEEHFESYVEIGTGVQADFALRCSGDSMINARILDGDIVFIRKQETVNNGEIAAVLLEDEATLKRVYISDNTITLLAENPVFPPRVIDLREDSDLVFKILGKAVAFQSDVK